MISDLNKLARDILEQNQYMTIGSSGQNSTAWVSPVAYAYDKDWNFYFASIPTSKHCSNLVKNKAVSFAIYDSRQDWGMGVGLQIEGVAEKVKVTELPKATTTYFSRKYPYGSITGVFAEGFKKLLKNNTYRFYKITPTKVWMNNPNAETDERVEIKLD